MSKFGDVSYPGMNALKLYMRGRCHYCHRLRLMLECKGVPYENMDAGLASVREQLGTMTPPVLQEEDHQFEGTHVITEYINERYPHPQLYPRLPHKRAMHRYYVMEYFDKLLSPRVDKLLDPGGSRKQVVEKVKDELLLEIKKISKISTQGENVYFMSNELSISDMALLPILWRLPYLGIEIERNRDTRWILDYQDRLFKTDWFNNSLSDLEREMR